MLTLVMHRAFIFLLLIATTACGSFRITQETSEVAFELPQPLATSRPTIYDGYFADLRDARLITLASVVATSDESRADDSVQEMYWRCRDLGADVILLGRFGSDLIGVTTLYVRFGGSYVSAIHSDQYIAIACRFSEKSLGLRWNERFRITEVSEAAARSGVEVGDEITRIAGLDVISHQTVQDTLSDPLNGYVETLALGDTVDVELVREGEGLVKVGVPVQSVERGSVSGPESDLARFIDPDAQPSDVRWPVVSRGPAEFDGGVGVEDAR